MIKKQKDSLEHQKKVQQGYKGKVSRLTSNVEVTKLCDLAKSLAILKLAAAPSNWDLYLLASWTIMILFP